MSDIDGKKNPWYTKLLNKIAAERRRNRRASPSSPGENKSPTTTISTNITSMASSSLSGCPSLSPVSTQEGKEESQRDKSKIGDLLNHKDREIEPLPPELARSSDRLLKASWFISSEVRDILSIPSWQQNMGNGVFPFICMHGDFCRFFHTRDELQNHLTKKPDHRVRTSELERRVGLMQETTTNPIQSPPRSSSFLRRSVSTFSSSRESGSRRRRRSAGSQSPRRRDCRHRTRSPSPKRARRRRRRSRSKSRSRSKNRSRSGSKNRSRSRSKSPSRRESSRSPHQRRRHQRRRSSETPPRKYSETKEEEDNVVRSCLHCDVILYSNIDYNLHVKAYVQNGRCVSVAPIEKSKCIRCRLEFSAEGLQRHFKNLSSDCVTFQEKFRPTVAKPGLLPRDSANDITSPPRLTNSSPVQRHFTEMPPPPPPPSIPPLHSVKSPLQNLSTPPAPPNWPQQPTTPPSVKSEPIVTDSVPQAAGLTPTSISAGTSGTLPDGSIAKLKEVARRLQSLEKGPHASSICRTTQASVTVPPDDSFPTSLIGREIVDVALEPLVQKSSASIYRDSGLQRSCIDTELPKGSPSPSCPQQQPSLEAAAKSSGGIICKSSELTDFPIDLAAEHSEEKLSNNKKTEENRLYSTEERSRPIVEEEKRLAENIEQVANDESSGNTNCASETNASGCFAMPQMVNIPAESVAAAPENLASRLFQATRAKPDIGERKKEKRRSSHRKPVSALELIAKYGQVKKKKIIVREIKCPSNTREVSKAPRTGCSSDEHKPGKITKKSPGFCTSISLPIKSTKETNLEKASSLLSHGMKIQAKESKDEYVQQQSLESCKNIICNDILPDPDTQDVYQENKWNAERCVAAAAAVNLAAEKADVDNRNESSRDNDVHMAEADNNKLIKKTAVETANKCGVSVDKAVTVTAMQERDITTLDLAGGSKTHYKFQTRRVTTEDSSEAAVVAAESGRKLQETTEHKIYGENSNSGDLQDRDNLGAIKKAVMDNDVVLSEESKPANSMIKSCRHDTKEETVSLLTLCKALDRESGIEHPDVSGGIDDDNDDVKDDKVLVLVCGDSDSIDHCPGCGHKLDPVKGNYQLNCVTFEVSVTCISCRKRVMIKEAFNERDKASLECSG